MAVIIGQQPDIWERLGTGLGAGVQKGVSEQLKMLATQKLKGLEREKEETEARELLSRYGIGIAPREQQRISPQDQQRVIQQEQQAPGAQRTYGQPPQQQTPKQQVNALMSTKGMTRKGALELIKLDREQQREINKETLPFYKEMYKAHKAGIDTGKRLDRMEVLNEQGNLSGPLLSSFVHSLKKGIAGYGFDLSGLLTADSQEFEKLSTDFLKDIKNIFGARITQMEVQLFMKTVPTLMQSQEGRARVIKNLRNFNEAAEVRYDAMRDIIDENGGRRPANLELIIDERTKPIMDRLTEEFKKDVEWQPPAADPEWMKFLKKQSRT